jgi:hypothetical protein
MAKNIDRDHKLHNRLAISKPQIDRDWHFRILHLSSWPSFTAVDPPRRLICFLVSDDDLLILKVPGARQEQVPISPFAHTFNTPFLNPNFVHN